MKSSQFNYYAGVAGITSALLFIVSIIGMQSYLATPLDDVLAFTQNMNDSHAMMLIYGWPGFIATILIIPLIYVFYKGVQAYAEISRILLVIIIIGLSFILVGYLFHLALTYFYAPIHHDMLPVQQITFEYIVKSTIGLQDMFWLSGDLLSFLGIAILLLLNLKQDQFPRWFLITGAIAGFFAAMGSIAFIPAFKHVPGLSTMFISGFSVFAIWEIVGGIILLKQ